MFPLASDAEAARQRTLHEFHDGLENYASVDNEPKGKEFLEQLTDKKCVREFPSLFVVRAYLKANLVVSKLALIVSVKDGVTKSRMVLDCRTSGSNDHTRKSEMILLPRVWDAIRDALDL